MGLLRILNNNFICNGINSSGGDSETAANDIVITF